MGRWSREELRQRLRALQAGAGGAVRVSARSALRVSARSALRRQRLPRLDRIGACSTLASWASGGRTAPRRHGSAPRRRRDLRPRSPAMRTQPPSFSCSWGRALGRREEACHACHKDDELEWVQRSRAKRRTGRRCREHPQHVDVGPTVLAALGARCAALAAAVIAVLAALAPATVRSLAWQVSLQVLGRRSL